MSKTIKKIILGAVVIIVALVAYRFFFVRPPEPLLESQSDRNQVIGRELLSLLNTLKSLTLNDQVFDRPEFISLTDFSVPISPNPLGRRNPFAPIGVGNFLPQNSAPVEEVLPEENTTSEGAPETENPEEVVGEEDVEVTE